MNVFVGLLILLLVSQHALGVEVYEGEKSVLLPYQVDVSVSEKSTVVWSREDLKNPTVHVRQPSGDDDGDQNQHYMNRTSMRPDALKTGDLSLTLRKPTVSDSGTYTCTVRRIGQILSVTQVQLLVRAPPPVWPWILAGVLAPLLLLAVFIGAVIGLANKAMNDRLSKQLKVVEVTEGAEDVDLLCTTRLGLTENIRVEWRRSVPTYKIVHMYENGKSQPSGEYRGRTAMKGNPQTGVLTLNLKNPHLSDGGVYICTVYRDGQNLRQKIVVLSVRETWMKTIRGLCQCCSTDTTDQPVQMSRIEENQEAAAGDPLMDNDTV